MLIMLLENHNIFWVVLLLNLVLQTCTAVTVTVDDVEVVEGSEARITCNIVSATSSFDPTVSWYNVTNGVTDIIATYQSGLGTVELGYSGRFSVENDNILVINNTHRSDSGKYQCIVSLVRDSPPIDNDICTMTVNYVDKPEIRFVTPVIEGDDVVMSCYADSSLQPVYSFTKDDGILQHGDSSTFTIPSVFHTDSGSYECEADNGVGSKLKSNNRILEIYYKPVTDEGLRDLIVYPGETIVITSKLSANPFDVTYLWTTDIPGNEDAIDSGATFTMKVATAEVDGAVYLANLTVTNSIGSNTYSTKIKISSPFDIQL
ncbi:junctional adhesion molecule A-like isoform X2 [Antedon mediterranea]